jgi:tetratricopeptide (TPR) repeat protein
MQADSTTQQDLGVRLQKAEDYLKRDPGNAELLAMAIELALATGDIGRAAGHAAEAGARHPAHPLLQYRRGLVLMAQEQWSAAAPLFAGLLAAHANVNLAYSLADCQLRAGACAAALETLAAYRDDPALPPQAVTLMVRALHRLGRFEAAADLLETHGGRARGDATFLAAASLMYLDQGRGDQAAAWAERALAGAERPIETELAIEYVNEALALNPAEGRSWSGLGAASLLRRDLAGASVQLENAVHYLPTHVGSWHALGWCHVMSGDLPAAERAFAQALALDRNFGESHGALAVVAAHQGERARAEATLELALRLDPACLSARYAQMVLNGQTADPERFKAIAQRFLRGHQTLDGEDLGSVVQRMTEQ